MIVILFRNVNKNSFLFEASIAYCFGDWGMNIFPSYDLRIHGFLKNLFHYSLLSYGYTILYRVNRDTIYDHR